MVEASSPSSAAPRKRVVLLGASNLTRSFSTVVETIRLLWGEPVEIFSALGHGRSYGLTTRVLGRELPGILPCGLWRALDAAPPAPTYALVTDIGNDLIYGARVETIVEWISTCFDRLAAHQSTITTTELPLSTLRSLSPRKFRLLSALLFPGRRFSQEELLHRAEALNEQLVALAAERRIRVISPENTWYGGDPIHYRRPRWNAAFEALLGPWRPAERTPTPPRGSLRRFLYLRTRVPESRRMFGVLQQRAQPSGQLADGTTIALY